MVFGHNIQYTSGAEFLSGGIYFDNIIFKIIYSFHMPLLMTISGYFFYSSILKYDVKGFVQKKVLMPILRIAIWSVPILCVYILKVFLSSNVEGNILYNIFKIFTGSYWFLWAIVFCSITVFLVNKIFKDNVFVYIILSLVLLIIPDAFNFHLYKFMLPYFIAGYFFNKNNCAVKLKNGLIKYKWCLLIVLGVYILLMLGFTRDIYIYNSGITLLNKEIIPQLGIDIYRYLVGGVGCILILWLFLIIKIPDKIKRVLIYVGKNSLAIYIIDDLLNRYVITKITQGAQALNYGVVFLTTVLIIVFVCMLVWVLDKIPKIKALLLG